MKSKSMLFSVGIAAALAVLATGAAISAQDRYSLKVPDELAFSEFKGYEAWQILGNPAMISDVAIDQRRAITSTDRHQ